MKSRKVLWLIVPLALVGIVLVVLVSARLGGPPRISARFLRQTNDASGGLHVIYEIRNGTRKSSEVMVHPPLQVLQERIGWWEADGLSTAWHVEQSAGIARDTQRAEFRPRSAATLEIRIQRLCAGGSALRGNIRTVKVEMEAVLWLRAIAHRLGLPPRWQMLPKPRFVELPEVSIRQLSPRVAAPPAVAAPAPALGSGTAVASAPPGLPATARPSEEIIPPGSIQFANANLRTVLDIYALLADAQLEVDSRARASRATYSFTNSQALNRPEAVLLFEQVLEQQGGIATKRVDPKHIRVMPTEH